VRLYGHSAIQGTEIKASGGKKHLKAVKIRRELETSDKANSARKKLWGKKFRLERGRPKCEENRKKRGEIGERTPLALGLEPE